MTHSGSARATPRHSRLTASREQGWQPTDTTRLVEAAGRLNIRLDDTSTNQLAQYAGLLLRWNRTFNLLGATTVDELRDLHLLDCLAINSVLEHWLGPESVRLFDIGSGAGLPGIPLAITHPKWALTLVEPVSKKAAFLRQSVATLGLHNVTVVEGRIEALPPASQDPDKRRHFISRAFTALDRFHHLCTDAGSKDSLIFAMKAARVHDEINALTDTSVVKAIEPLPTARPEHDRVIVVLATEAAHAN